MSKYAALRAQLERLHVRETPNPEGYRANPKVHWPVLIDFGRRVHRDEFLPVFRKDWVIYGYSPDEGKWTYPDALGTPSEYTQLEVAVDLAPHLGPSAAKPTESSLRETRDDIVKRAHRLGARDIRTAIPESDPAARSGALIALREELDGDYTSCDEARTVHFNVETEDDDSGVVELLEEIGLELFELDMTWRNGTGCLGEDSIFRVIVEDGTGFTFDIPRVAVPDRVHRAAHAVALVVCDELGGELRDGDDEFDLRRFEARVLDVTRRLERVGLVPGEAATMMLL
jgi:hypothetical protein